MNATTIFCIAAVLCFSLPSAAQEQEEAELSFAFDFSSAYVWRGLVVVNDPVFQPAATLSYAGFSAGIWMNIDLTDVNQYPEGTAQYEPTEVDYTLDYSYTSDWVTLGAGLIHYAFPNTGFDSTTEVYATVSIDTFLSLGATLYRDIDMSDGVYILFSAGKSLELNGPINRLEASVSMGYGDENNNAFYWGYSEYAITDMLFSLSAPVELGKGLSITPHVGLSIVIDEMLRDRVEEPDIFIAGAMLSYSF